MASQNKFDPDAKWGGSDRTVTGFPSGANWAYGADYTDPTTHWGGMLLNSIDKKRCFVVEFSNGTYKHPYYFGVTNDKTIGASLGIPGVHSGMYGVGTDKYSGGESYLQSFTPSGMSDFGDGDSPRLSGLTGASVYIDPAGKCWICHGRAGFDSTATEGNTGYALGGGNPITGISPTFTFPATGNWYIDVRASAESEPTANSMTGKIAFYFDPEWDEEYPEGVIWLSYSRGWPSAAKTGYTVGWNEVVNDIYHETAMDRPTIFAMADWSVDTGIGWPFGYGEVESGPPVINAEMVLRAFRVESVFGAKANFHMQPFSVKASVVKAAVVRARLGLKAFRVDAVAGSSDSVYATFTLPGLTFKTYMTKNQLMEGLIKLKAFSVESTVIKAGPINAEVTMPPLEVKARLKGEQTSVILRYSR